MTSIEFAAKYRLLKNVATRGARSFLAQQVELGRMVMVHYLDAEDIEQRATTLARLEALRPPGRDKLLEIADVDGTPVAVTLFISSFKDFATWLDSVIPHAPAPQQLSTAPAAPSQPGEFTRAFHKLEAPTSPVIAAPPPEPAPKRDAPKRTPGEFTRIFGKVDEATLEPTTESSLSDVGAPVHDEEEIPTVIMEAVTPPKPTASEASKPAPTADSGSSFTAIFGALGTAPAPASGLPPTMPSVAPPRPAPVMTPTAPPIDLRPATPSPAPQAPTHQPGEFTQLFQRLSPSGGTTPPPSLGAAPFFAAEVPRPLEPTPRADFAAAAPPPSAPSLPTPSLGIPPLAAPALGAPVLGAPLLGAPSLGSKTPPPSNGSALPNVPPVMPPAPSAPPAPPRSWGAPAAPPPIGASVFGTSAPSEFTRILSPIAAPPPPPVSIQPPGAPAQAAGGAGAKSKSMLPLIIGLAVVVVLTIVMVAYFVMRK